MIVAKNMLSSDVEYTKLETWEGLLSELVAELEALDSSPICYVVQRIARGGDGYWNAAFCEVR